MSDLTAFFAMHPRTAEELYLSASEIVDDFEDFGPVLQASEDGKYDGSTALGRLRAVRNSIIEALESAGPTGA